MKTFFAMMAASLLFLGGFNAADAQNKQKEVLPAGIVSDEMKDGLRVVHYRPDDIVCSVDIEIHTQGDVIEYVKFTKGCNGNAKGIGALIKGMKMDEAIAKLQGITCGRRPTSCPDQLANALIAIQKAKPAKNSAKKK